jgi:hypothetical protein
MFPRIYDNVSCPLDDYEGYSFRVLLNPTRAEIDDWHLGHPGTEGCADCAKLSTARGKQGSATKKYCEACTEARDRLGRGAVAVYGTSHVDGLDFSTPESSLATLSQADLPNELLLWLYMLPDALWVARTEDMKKKLPRSLETGDSMPSSA